MKKLLLMLVFASMFMIGCEGVSSKEVCSPACGAWETCNEKLEVCVLLDGRCNVNSDCAGNQTCDTTTHACKAVTGACGDVTCDNNGECSEVAGAAVCTCDTGFLASKDKLHCFAATVCADVTCSGHGTCLPSRTGQATCECDAGYTVNGLNCVEQACGKCEVRQNGVCVPDGGRPCNGDFNDRCDPALDDAQGNNPDCASGYCFGDDAENGYCSMLDCVTDSDCIDPRYINELFICIKYGEDYRGMCQKIEDAACTEIKRDGAVYSSCDTPCGDADCEQTELCISGICAPECNGPNDVLSCLAGYECYNINTDDFPLYRCVEEIIYCKNDSECADGESCNYFYLDQVLGQDAITVACGDAEGQKGNAEACNPDATSGAEACESGLCLAPRGATAGECSVICNSSVDCAITGHEHNLCVSLALFSDTEAAVPICIKDELVFDTVRFQGMCEDGCPEGSACSFNSVASVVTSADEIEYICLSGVSSGTKNFGEICTADAQCKSGLCGEDGKCNTFCGVDLNCPNGFICEPTLRLYAETVDNDTMINSCVAGVRTECTANADCTGVDTFCKVVAGHPEQNICVECLVTDDCGANEVCTDNVCVEEVLEPACTVANEATTCTVGTDLHCLANTDTSLNECVECVSNTHCAENGKGTHCFQAATANVAVNTCGCQSDNDCTSGVCVNNACALKK